MRNRNTMKPFSYIGAHLVWGTMFFIWYKSLLFANLFHYWYRESLIALAVMVAVSSALGILVTMKRRRNYVSVAVNLSIGFGSYFILSLWEVLPAVAVTTGAIAAILALLYVIVVFILYERDRSKGHRTVPIKKCAIGCFHGSRAVFAAVLATVIIPIAFCMVLERPIFQVNSQVQANPPETKSYGDMIIGNMDTLLLLQEEEWGKLDPQQRLDLIQVISDIESDYLGIPRVPLVADLVQHGATLGYYSDLSKTITISIDVLSNCDSHTAVHTALHETYHSYEHRLVSLYEWLDESHQELHLFEDASVYAYEFSHYIDGTEDFENYENQACEKDANRRADDCTSFYFWMIDEYLNAKTEAEGAPADETGG